MSERDIVQRIARLLCYEKCRAGICKEQEHCMDSWPGDGSSLKSYLSEAKEMVMLAAAEHS